MGSVIGDDNHQTDYKSIIYTYNKYEIKGFPG
jgi:hypothetical protein